RRADDSGLLRVARAGVGYRHHRPDRGGGREDVPHAVAREEVELLVRLKSRLPLVYALDRPHPPRPQQRADTSRPRPLAHAVEELALADVVAVAELLVGEYVAVGMDDALGHARGPRRVVELRGVVGQRVGSFKVGRHVPDSGLIQNDKPGAYVIAEALCVGRIRDEDPWLCVAEPVA